jgi:hypothetical protein
MKRYFLGVAAAVLGTVMVSGTAVRADDAVPAADPAPATVAPTTIELPLFGAPLTLGITTDPGGALTEVSVEPADSTVATKLKPHKVVFKSTNSAADADPNDVARVVVKSRHGGQSVSARVGSLDDLTQVPGSWSGDVFGTPTKVTFQVAAAADGTADITGTSVDPVGGEIGDVKHSSGDNHDGEGSSSSARVSIKFTSSTGDQSRVLSIRVKAHEHDGKTSAQLSIGLSPIKGEAVDAATAMGPHTWSGVLCDNKAATISYNVAEDGTVSDVTATPADTAVVKTDGDKIWVKFSDHEWVFIKVRERDGQIKISAQALLHCDSGDPTTNVDVTIPTPDSEDGHNGGSDWGHGDHRGGGDKGGSHGGA